MEGATGGVPLWSKERAAEPVLRLRLAAARLLKRSVRPKE